MINGLGALSSLFSSAMNAGTSQYSNPQIAAISQQEQNAGSFNDQADQLMLQTIQDMKNKKISPHQALDVYEQLKKAGASGGNFKAFDKIFGEASLARSFNKSELIPDDIGRGMAKIGDYLPPPNAPAPTPAQAAWGLPITGGSQVEF